MGHLYHSYISLLEGNHKNYNPQKKRQGISQCLRIGYYIGITNFYLNWLVVLTILKNDGVRRWEGWHPIYDMENNPFMFETTNQLKLASFRPKHGAFWPFFHHQALKDSPRTIEAPGPKP